jgi:hypothetical protein
MKSKYFTSSPRTITDFRKIRKADRHGITPERMLARHEVRQKANITPRPLSVMRLIQSGDPYMALPNGVKTIPLGDHRAFLELPSLQDSRKKNWNSPESTFGRSQIKTNDMGRYSSRCTYTHYTYTRLVQSWGYVVSPKHLYIRIDHNLGLISRLLSAPRGYYFSHDKNGIKIVSNSNKKIEYHPTAFDFIHITSSSNKFKDIIQNAKYLYKVRKDNEKRQRLEKRKKLDTEKYIKDAENQGCFVSFVDSILAGNCQAGTEAWAARCGLDKSQHYRPSLLLQHGQKTGNEKLVKIAVFQAIRRHQREISQGYSMLAHHVLGYPVVS